MQDFNREILNDRLRKSTDDYNEYNETFKAIRKRIKRLKRDTSDRQAGWVEQVMRYSKLVARNFDMYMQKKGFSGTGMY